MRKIIYVLLLLQVAACARQEKILHFNQASEFEIPKEKVKENDIDMPSQAEFLYADSPEIKQALREFKKTGKAAIIKKAGFVQFPYGEYEPVVYCNPLRLCDIELEPGEKVIDFGSGDNLRWNFFVSVSGSENAEAKLPVHHLMITPRELDLSTNFIITTDRRTYNLRLVSMEKDYYPRVKFYYPHQTLERFSKLNAERLEENANKESNLCFPDLSLEKLYFDYQMESNRKVDWKPIRVFDNGEKVFIQMPKSQELPILLVQSSGSSNAEIVNYRAKCNYLIVDKVFEQAILVTGEGRRKKQVLITRK